MNMPFKTKMKMSVNYLKGNTARQINSDKKKKVIMVHSSAVRMTLVKTGV